MKGHKNTVPFRILVIDDNTAIHKDFCKVLMKSHKPDDALHDMESALFGSESQTTVSGNFEIDTASQGKEGLALVKKAKSEGHPYALAFVDGRMPPGWDGVETIGHLWQECPDLQVVLCTAYADYSWQEIRRVLGETDSLLILKKPFDNVEVLQLAHTLTRKWAMSREIQERINDLGDTVRKETKEKEHIGALLEAALEHSPSGIIISDEENSEIRWSNSAALRILNKAHPFFPKDKSDGHGDDWQVFGYDGKLYGFDELPLTRATVKGETIHNEEFIIRNANGHEKWISSNAAPVHGSDGSISAGISVFQDITERIRSQKEKERLHSHLFQAKKMESLGILSGGIAHDFTDLLHGISENIESILVNKNVDHKGAARFQTIVESIDRATKLVRELMQFSLMDEAQKQQVDINYELAEAVKMFDPSLPETIAIELDIDHSVWPILADPMQVEQVMLKLGSNAMDAMPDGGKMSISTQNLVVDDDFDKKNLEIRSGRYVVMTVSDTGTGMDKKTLGRVFEPFFTTKEAGKGSGLGLSSVYGIVKVHDGFVHCTTEPGQGTTFKIYWPTLPETDAGKILSLPSENRINSETILVVDDDNYVREMMTKMLGSFGYTAINAACGADALTIVDEKGSSIDMVVLDLNMPDMDGYQCLKKMLEQNFTRPILISSGYAPVVNKEELMQAGAGGFICKPFKLRELLTVVRTLLDERGNPNTA